MILIGGLQKTTLIDYPGRVACTVFLIGCNFRCPFCYNRGLVLPEEIKKQPKIPEKEFFKFLKERKRLLEGICLTGGEPTLNRDLPKFIKKIKKLGYLVKLDTNGSIPQMLKRLIDEKLIDYAAMDIKASLKSQNYDRAAGVRVNLNNIKKSIAIIKKSGIDYEFRMTVVPGFHTKEDIIKIARWIGPVKKFCLQNFKPEKTIDSKFEKIKPHSKDFLLEIKEEISQFFEICEVRE